VDQVGMIRKCSELVSDTERDEDLYAKVNQSHFSQACIKLQLGQQILGMN